MNLKGKLFVSIVVAETHNYLKTAFGNDLKGKIKNGT